MYGMMSFYRKLRGRDRLVFLNDLFYLGRYNPGYYFFAWFIGLVVLFLFKYFVALVFIVFLLFVWYFVYFLLVLLFIIKWKKKSLYSS